MATANKVTVKNQSERALRLYLKEISTIPLLHPDEERQLGHRIQQGDQQALEQMVKSNLRFVVKIAKRYRGLGVSFLDLINEGNLGLIEAAKRFDPSRNVKFISYAVWQIRQSIFSLLSSLGRPLRLPARVNTALYKLNRLKDGDHKPSLQEQTSATGMTETELIFLQEVGGEWIPLHQPLTPENGRTLEEQLAQTSIPSVEQVAIDRSVRESLNKVLSELGTREQQILRLRYGLDDDSTLTLQQIGDRIGLSRERVRQIEEKAMQKLRDNRKAISLVTNFRMERALAS